MILDLVLIGVAIALDPLPLTAFLVVLPSKRGVRKGAAFVFGWLVSLAIVVTVTVLATGNNPPQPNTAPSLASLAVKIALGVVLVAIAVRHMRADAAAEAAEEAAQVAGARGQHVPVVRHGPGPDAAALGADRRGRGHGGGGQAVQLGELPGAVRVLRPGLGVLPGHGDLRRSGPDKSQALLARFRTWIDAHTDQVIIWGSLIIGLWLIAEGIYLIVT